MKLIKPRDDLDLEEKRRYPARAVVDDSLFEAYMVVLAADLDCPFEEVGVVEDAPRVHIDGGGMVSMNEPVARAAVRGCEFTCYARQLEIVLPALRRVKTEGYGTRVAFGGRWLNFIFAPDTARELAEKWEAEAERLEPEIQRQWEEMEAALKKVNSDGLRAFSPSREQTKKINAQVNQWATAEDN